jgi:CRISPR-associated exonuclease Cas4
MCVSIRNLQHYMYCPHRWGLINIDCSWMENYFVTKGNLIHERVHDPDQSYYARNKRVLTSVPVYNDEIGIYGVTDCIELRQSARGVKIPGYSDNYQLTIVEYKPRKPKEKDFYEEDVLQVFAQKICVDKIFHCDSEGVIYYADIKKRVKLPLNEMYDDYLAKLKEILTDIRDLTERGEIPPIRKKQKCSGCSFHDLCLPEVLQKKRKSDFHKLLHQDDL